MELEKLSNIELINLKSLVYEEISNRIKSLTKIKPLHQVDLEVEAAIFELELDGMKTTLRAIAEKIGKPKSIRTVQLALKRIHNKNNND